MATATFHEDTFVTTDGRTVYMKYIMCNYDDITIRKIDTTVAKSNYYGINGTFFWPAAQLITGIAINNGTQVRNYGLQNRDPRAADPSENRTEPIPAGTFFKLKERVNGVFLGTADIDTYEGTQYEGATLTVANTKFAIGGVSLYPSDSNLTETSFYNAIRNQYSAYDRWVARSAIIYIGGSTTGLNTILLTVHGKTLSTTGNDTLTQSSSGLNLWELRRLINEKFAPMISSTATSVVHAIALDSGASTQIAYKKDGKKYSCQASYDGVSTTSNVYTMLSVPM